MLYLRRSLWWLHRSRVSKIKTGAGKIKAGCSLTRVTAGGAGKQVFGVSSPIVLRKSLEWLKHSTDKKSARQSFSTCDLSRGGAFVIIA